METLNDRAANLLRSLLDLAGAKTSKLLETILVNVRSAMNKPLGFGIRVYATFGFLVHADRRTFWRK